MTADEFNKRVKAGEKWKVAGQESARKYHEKRATAQGEKFHSQLEADDSLILADYVRRGMIGSVSRQVRFKLYAQHYHITDALVDFEFFEPRSGDRIWYETKGFETERFRILKKLIVANLGPGELYIINREELEQYLRCRSSGKPYEQRRY